MSRLDPSPIRLLGLDFDPLDLEETAARIEARGTDAPFRYVVTPNADHLVRLRRTPSLRPVYERAWLRLLDSRVVAGAGRLLGLDMPPVVPGSDLTRRLVAAVPRGERLAIVGMRAEAARALAERCGLADPHHHEPPPAFETDPGAFARAVQFVLEHPARLIFLAVGSPRQERLAAAIAACPGATGTALCIGASLDYLAGAARRAPAWMQQTSLEWVHRLAHDPKRLARRYLLDDPMIFPMLMRERQAQRTSIVPGA